MKLSVMIISVSGLILSSNVFSATIRVPSDQSTIQAGIDAAIDGDTVLVADGIYTGVGNRDLDFRGQSIAVASENGAQKCVIYCQLNDDENHRGFNLDKDQSITVIIDGFTIKNACYTQAPSIFEAGGGGINCDSRSSRLVVSNCLFIDNIAYRAGGIGTRSSASITNCAFINNSGLRTAGAIYAPCPQLTINKCLFFRNNAGLNEIDTVAAVVYISNRKGSICDSYFYENSGGPTARGICCFSQGDISISNCVISKNTFAHYVLCNAPLSYSVRIENCTIAENTTKMATFDNGLLSGMSVSNCITWNNSPHEFIGANTPVTFSNIRGGYSGVGNICSDPLFRDVESFDYRLLPESPCIDTGSSEDSPAYDIEGNPRPQGAGVDMGAYEFIFPVTTAFITMPSHLFKPGDKASCIGSVWNPHEYGFDEYLFFAVLDIWGTFYCAPSYNMIDYYYLDCNPGLTEIQIMPEFTWPSGVGSVSGIVWYAGLVNPEMTELVSEIGVFDFGWSE